MTTSVESTNHPRSPIGIPSRSPIGLNHRSRSRYERTNGRTNGEITYVSHKSSLTDTCARVQNRSGWVEV